MLMVNKTDKDDFVKYVHQRIYQQNKNFVCFFSGPTGSGKTYSALRFSEKLDPNFDINNIVFTAEEFMNLLNGKAKDENGNVKELKQGSVILWEEIQTSMGHMDYQSFVSKAINYVLTTFRHKNLILIVTAPYFSFINASTRKLFHAVFEVQGIDRARKVTKSKPLFLQINQRSGKIYFKYMRIARGNGFAPQIKRYNLGLPSKELLEAYEERKTEFTSGLNEEILEELEQRMADKSGKKLTAKQEKVLKLLINKKMPKEISEMTESTLNSVYKQMKSIEKKGIKLVKHSEEGENAAFYEVRGYEMA